MSTTYASLPVGVFTKTLKDVFLNEAGKVTNYIDRLYEVTRTDLIQNTYQSFAGLGPANTWNGEETISFETIQARYQTTITQIFYRKGVKFTWKMKKYEQYGLMRDMISSLARAMAQTKQIYAISFFNQQLAGGVSNAPWNATEGKFLFDSGHPLATGGTYDNLISGALSVTTLQAAIATLFKTPDDQGNVMGIRPTRLWVAPDGYANAVEVVNKGVGLRSDTEKNTKNFFDEYGIEVTACEYLTDTDGWFLQGDYNKAICEVSANLEQSQWTDNDDKSTIHDAIFALNVGALDWRGWVGSKGA
jgi:phage major head subunit gpT-like protein